MSSDINQLAEINKFFFGDSPKNYLGKFNFNFKNYER